MESNRLVIDDDNFDRYNYRDSDWSEGDVDDGFYSFPNYNNEDIDDVENEQNYYFDEVSMHKDDGKLYIFLYYLYRNCIVPSMLQIFHHLKLLLLLCVIFNLSAVFFQKVLSFNLLSNELHNKLLHCVSFVIGLVALHSFQGSKIINFLSLICIVYGTLFFCEYTSPKKSIKGPVVTFIVLSHLLICELICFDQSTWHTIRGTQMILSMKLISLAFDIDNKVIKHIPNFFNVFGYSLHVGSLIFGPWISYKDYLNCCSSICTFTTLNCGKWLVKCSICLTTSLICLIISTCFSEVLASHQSNIWLQSYKEALSFRFSHYFVCKLSEATILLSSNNFNYDVPITKIRNIELPRSLVDVVVSWNIPMHKWLKTYIFQTSRHLGDLASILITYIISAFLHGLNFQLSAVLLSLGIYSYIEYNLRRKLSYLLNACVQTRSCKAGCQHRHQHDLIVLATNSIFFVITIFHLAYLGCTFDNNDTQTQGYSMAHTLSKWSHLAYASPILAIMMMSINFILRCNHHSR
ncbi:hypothetical protein HELRODRAFT_98326 [Helobdella robusta]|uniref:Protein-serine O-palmitoleoyltransferase porcupine n=1 Tax=Helobdella robusta TaxID=6412 RepID=T1G9M0_HELRO|nr:hypothetical protein HELRODRAFT_98326 [Helobdella robusta]ESO08230.1 hypothetical protein HELRODRAFT_98326 [Helobdella robusta]